MCIYVCVCLCSRDNIVPERVKKNKKKTTQVASPHPVFSLTQTDFFNLITLRILLF